MATYHILTEGSDNLVTEAGDFLVTEAEPSPPVFSGPVNEVRQAVFRGAVRMTRWEGLSWRPFPKPWVDSAG